MKAVTSVLLLIAFSLAHKHASFLSQIPVESITTQWSSAATMKATPTVLSEDGWIDVSISGIKSHHKEDKVAVYSPSNVDISKTAPIKYKHAKDIKDGKVRFYLINRRADYMFVYLRDVDNRTVALAKSNTVAFTNYAVPTGGHLALDGNTGHMVLTWQSNSTVKPAVKYGVKSGVYDQTRYATSFTYTREQMCGEPASTIGWRDPGQIHRVTLDGLSEGTQYFYIYGDAGGWSQEHSFHSAPTVAPETEVHLIAYGDMGKAEVDGSDEHWEEYPSINTTDNVISRLKQIDLVLHIGDIAYAVGYGSQWDQFLHQIEPVATSVPYMTCIGNHERDFPHSDSFYNGTDSGGECGVPYESFFPLPDASRDEPWYSFDYGNVHFAFMSTEHNFLTASAQHRWIEQDLKSVDRKKTPWIVFSGHRPMYIDSTGGQEIVGGTTEIQLTHGLDQPVAKLLREHVEPLLHKYQVDLALWGHHHSYQRSCPVYKEKCVDGGTVHVVIGMAGMGLSKNLEPTPPVWSLVQDLAYGFSEINATRKELSMKYFRNTGELKDEFTLHSKF